MSGLAQREVRGSLNAGLRLGLCGAPGDFSGFMVFTGRPRKTITPFGRGAEAGPFLYSSVFPHKPSENIRKPSKLTKSYANILYVSLDCALQH